jgi:hypothetical protein
MRGSEGGSVVDIVVIHTLPAKYLGTCIERLLWETQWRVYAGKWTARES